MRSHESQLQSNLIRLPISEPAMAAISSPNFHQQKKHTSGISDSIIWSYYTCPAGENTACRIDFSICVDRGHAMYHLSDILGVDKRKNLPQAWLHSNDARERNFQEHWTRQEGKVFDFPKRAAILLIIQMMRMRTALSMRSMWFQPYVSSVFRGATAAIIVA